MIENWQRFDIYLLLWTCLYRFDRCFLVVNPQLTRFYNVEALNSYMVGCSIYKCGCHAMGWIWRCFKCRQSTMSSQRLHKFLGLDLLHCCHRKSLASRKLPPYYIGKFCIQNHHGNRGPLTLKGQCKPHGLGIIFGRILFKISTPLHQIGFLEWQIKHLRKIYTSLE